MNIINTICVIIDSTIPRRRDIKGKLSTFMPEENIIIKSTTEWPHDDISDLLSKNNTIEHIVVLVHWDDTANIGVLKEIYEKNTLLFKYIKKVSGIIAYRGEVGSPLIQIDKNMTNTHEYYSTIVASDGNTIIDVPIYSIHPPVNKDSVPLEELKTIVNWCLYEKRNINSMPKYLRCETPWISVAKILIQGYMVVMWPDYFPELKNNKEILDIIEANKNNVETFEYWQPLASVLKYETASKDVTELLYVFIRFYRQEYNSGVTMEKDLSLKDLVFTIWSLFQ